MGDFYRAGGNELLWTALPLGDNDLVLDVGGFHGDWTAEILKRYGCRSIIFEPVPEMVANLKQLYSANQRVEIVAAGLGAKSASAVINVMADASSTLRSGDSGRTVEIQIIGACDLILQRQLTDIGCVKINIEGAEYDLLDEMIARGCTKFVRSFLIQFHNFVDDHIARRQRIQNALQQTHEKVFDFPFVWERWNRKP